MESLSKFHIFIKTYCFLPSLSRRNITIEITRKSPPLIFNHLHTLCFHTVSLESLFKYFVVGKYIEP